MGRKKKILRQSKIRQRDVWRDSMGRFSTKDNRVSEERWYYRVDKKGRIQDLKIDALPFMDFETTWFRSIKLPDTGSRTGKLSARLKPVLKQIGASRTDTHMEISMTAKTYHGKIVKRKLSFYHHNTKKLESHTVGGIINELFYAHGDRPAYPVKIVKGWRKRETTKKETERRRQLYDVTFTIKSTIESRKKRK